MPLIVAVVALLAQIGPYLSTAGAVAHAIKTLVGLAPLLVQTAKDLVPTVKGLISDLRGSGHLTPEQHAELDAVEAKIDADYDAASAAAQAEDDAAAAGSAPVTT